MVQPIVRPPITSVREFVAEPSQTQVAYRATTGPCGGASSETVIGALSGTTTSREHRSPAEPFTRITSATAFAPAARLTLPVRHEFGSMTVTWNVQVVELPDESLAVQLTVVGPKPNVVPEAGEQMTVGLGSTESLEVTE